MVFVPLCAYAQQEGTADIKPFYSPYEEITKLHVLRPATTPEQIGMAFLKLSDLQPDFTKWAALTPKSQSVPEYDRDIVALQELSRLQNEYENLDIEEPLVIRTLVEMRNFSAAQEILFLNEIGPRTYFKFNAYDLPIVILPRGLAQFSKLKLPPREADFVFERQRGRDNAILELAVVPERVVTERTVTLNNGDFYPIVARIAQFSLWTHEEDSTMMWTYRAPWFEGKNQDRDLLNLYVK